MKKKFSFLKLIEKSIEIVESVTLFSHGEYCVLTIDTVELLTEIIQAFDKEQTLIIIKEDKHFLLLNFTIMLDICYDKRYDKKLIKTEKQFKIKVNFGNLL